MKTIDDKTDDLRRSAQRISTFLLHLKFLLSDHKEDLALGDVSVLTDLMIDSIEQETHNLLVAIN